MAGSSSDAGGTLKGVPYDEGGVPYVTRRALEINTAAVVALVGAVVMVESLTHDIGWNETGPGSGYFPFRVGLLLIVAAGVRLLQCVRDRASDAFVTREGLRRSLGVFWPTAALVVAMFPLGCYTPAAAYLAWMMRRHGGHSWLVSIAYGTAVMVAFFLVFDLWFRVPLAKGPVEAVFGF